MRRAISLLGTLAVGGWALFVTHQVWAFPALARQTKAACAACHVNPAGGVGLTAGGAAYKADAKAALSVAAKASDYVGSNKCKTCHLKQHKAWAATNHAQAWMALEKADEKKVAERAAALKVEVTGTAHTADACVECHVTGFHLPGGYPASDSSKNASLKNVTCEACHGPGAKHVAAPMAEKKKLINRNVTANLCKQCHTPEMSPKFDFDVYKKKGVHVVASAAKPSG
jgi:hypothetical protein